MGSGSLQAPSGPSERRSEAPTQATITGALPEAEPITPPGHWHAAANVLRKHWKSLTFKTGGGGEHSQVGAVPRKAIQEALKVIDVEKRGDARIVAVGIPAEAGERHRGRCRAAGVGP